MIFGFGLAVLTLIRLVIRVKTDKPAPAPTGKPLLDKLGPAIHHGFYLFILVMAGFGLATSIAAGLPDIVFGGSGAPLPKDFFAFWPRYGHAIVATILVLMIGLHIAGALYHQFKLKDGLLARMWFGKRRQIVSRRGSKT